jgi:hypothetical protein
MKPDHEWYVYRFIDRYLVDHISLLVQVKLLVLPPADCVVVKAGTIT